MTAVIHLKSGEIVSVSNYSYVIIRTDENQNSEKALPKYPADKMEIFDFRHGEQCNFVGNEKIVSVFADEILFVETIID